ncbi:unnamed protein product [Vitrella brassicaformis CCMP3155]|uniref:TLDc domain-containing protein n=1 Tax=Vitrella brassicaformis (strain CCMP3155) TaxID=1169540 RepID=A0A0G4GTI1_VITBC|nr:unnamed protein product [Vitrella brassicaformis CCMP3155]|eukprot:CEM34071.1 unnamed protein product [Vitrella brassicaformis CCMP3155]
MEATSRIPLVRSLCSLVPPSLRVMSLEEAGDQLIRAEEAARGKTIGMRVFAAIVVSVGLVCMTTGFAICLSMATLTNNTSVEQPVAEAYNDTHAAMQLSFLSSPVSTGQQCPAVCEAGEWEGQHHDDSKDEQSSYHGLPGPPVDEAAGHAADTNGDVEEDADEEVRSKASSGYGGQLFLLLALALAAFSAYQAAQIQALQTHQTAIQTSNDNVRRTIRNDIAALLPSSVDHCAQLREYVDTTMATIRQDTATGLAALKAEMEQQMTTQLQDQKVLIESTRTEMLSKTSELQQAIGDNSTYVDTNLQQHATKLQELQSIIESNQTIAQKNTDELSTATRRELRAQAAQIQALHAKVDTQAEEMRALKGATDTSIDQLRTHVDTDLEQHATQLQEQQALIESNRTAAQKNTEELEEAIRKEIRAQCVWADSPLTIGQYVAMCNWLGGKEFNIIYKSSRDGTTYSDLLRCVASKNGLVIIIRRGTYVFGVYISAGLQLPDDPTKSRRYSCDLWYFSLAGHFPTPTKIDINEECQLVVVAGRERIVGGANVYIGGDLRLGWGGFGRGGRPAVDICRCRQWTSGHVPEGYTGERDEDGCAMLGGVSEFMADEIEVLHVVGQ